MDIYITTGTTTCPYLTLEPGTLAAMAMDTTSAGPSAVLPDSSKLRHNKTSTICIWSIIHVCVEPCMNLQTSAIKILSNTAISSPKQFITECLAGVFDASR